MGKRAAGIRRVRGGGRLGVSKGSKYKNTKVAVDGITFDSKREAKRYQELKLLERAGEIANLTIQPKFPLRCNGRDILIRSNRYYRGRKATYYADFSYTTKEGRVVEDVKGADTALSRLKRAIVEAEYGVRVEIVR